MKVKSENGIFNENVKKPIKRRYSKANNNFDCDLIPSPSTSIASNSSIPTQSQPTQTDCYICGDKATGKHYGK